VPAGQQIGAADELHGLGRGCADRTQPQRHPQIHSDPMGHDEDARPGRVEQRQAGQVDVDGGHVTPVQQGRDRGSHGPCIMHAQFAANDDVHGPGSFCLYLQYVSHRLPLLSQARRAAAYP